MNKTMNLKVIGVLVLLAFTFILFLVANPWSWNDGGNRTVVEQMDGEQKVQFSPGVFYAGFWAKEREWPNQISVTYMDTVPNLELEDNGIEVGQIEVMFSDGTTAKLKGITQFILPSDPEEMIRLHNTHRTPQSLVIKRLATFTKESLQSAAQLMTSDKHYGGGRTQMTQDFLDQLRHGVYLASVKERVYYDSIDKENKRLYLAEIKTDKNGQALRKSSPLLEFGISVADGAVTDTDYASKVDTKLEKIIDAATKSAVSRQELMTAQQQALTARAKGEQALVEIEYQQKQDQTKQVVAAETKVRVAEQDMLQQKIQAQAAELEAKKIKTLADAEAYRKRAVLSADGALQQKLDAWLQAEEYKWAAFGQFKGNLVPQVQSGAVGVNNGLGFMEIMSAKAAKDLSLDLQMNK